MTPAALMEPLAGPNLDICNDAQARQFSGCIVMMREQLRLSDAAIANRIGMSVGQLERVEREISRPTVRQLGEAWKILLAAMPTSLNNELTRTYKC